EQRRRDRARPPDARHAGRRRERRRQDRPGRGRAGLGTLALRAERRHLEALAHRRQVVGVRAAGRPRRLGRRRAARDLRRVGGPARAPSVPVAERRVREDGPGTACRGRHHLERDARPTVAFGTFRAMRSAPPPPEPPDARRQGDGPRIAHAPRPVAETCQIVTSADEPSVTFMTPDARSTTTGDPRARRRLAGAIAAGVLASLFYFAWWLEDGRIADPLLGVAFVLAAVYVGTQIYCAWFVYLHIARPTPVP